MCPAVAGRASGNSFGGDVRKSKRDRMGRTQSNEKGCFTLVKQKDITHNGLTPNPWHSFSCSIHVSAAPRLGSYHVPTNGPKYRRRKSTDSKAVKQSESWKRNDYWILLTSLCPPCRSFVMSRPLSFSFFYFTFFVFVGGLFYLHPADPDCGPLCSQVLRHELAPLKVNSSLFLFSSVSLFFLLFYFLPADSDCDPLSFTGPSKRAGPLKGQHPATTPPGRVGHVHQLRGPSRTIPLVPGGEPLQTAAGFAAFATPQRADSGETARGSGGAGVGAPAGGVRVPQHAGRGLLPVRGPQVRAGPDTHRDGAGTGKLH